MTISLSNPPTWFSEVFVSKWMDQGVCIDGILHIFGPTTGGIGAAIRDITSTFPSSTVSLGMAPLMRPGGLGQNLRPIQTGRIQQYLILSLVVLLVVGGLALLLLTGIGAQDGFSQYSSP
jgi:hypothetical protein